MTVPLDADRRRFILDIGYPMKFERIGSLPDRVMRNIQTQRLREF
jgi:hypothetical protein